MSNLILSEWYKLRKDRSFRFLSVGLILLGMVYPILAAIDSRMDGDDFVSGIRIFADAVAANDYFLKITIGVLAGFFISGEFTNGVMKRAVSAGSSRTRVYAAKLTVYTVGACVLSVLFPLVNMIVGSLIGGFGELAEVDAVLFLFRSLGFTMLFAAAFASLSALFAFTLADSGKTIGLTIVFFLFIDTIFNLLGSQLPFVQKIYEYTVFHLYYVSAMNFILSARDMWMSLAIPAATYLVLLAWGVCVFRSKEIK